MKPVEKTVGSITTKPQLVGPHDPHLRPNGKQCMYMAHPPICFRCGALLDAKPVEEEPE